MLRDIAGVRSDMEIFWRGLTFNFAEIFIELATTVAG